MEIRSFDDLLMVVGEYREAGAPQRPMMVCFGPADAGESNVNLDKFKKTMRGDMALQFDINEVTEPAPGVQMIVLHRYFAQMDEAALQSCVDAVSEYGLPVLCLTNQYDFKICAVKDFDVVYYCTSASEFSEEPVEMHEDVEDWLVKSLQKTFDEMRVRIHFKPNPKYDPDPRGVFYIGYSDMSRYEYTIRKKVGEEYMDDEDPIVATYHGGMSYVLADGWRAD